MQKQRSLGALVLMSALLSCQAASEAPREPPPIVEGPNQWLALPQAGPVASLSALCAPPYTCGEVLTPLSAAPPVIEAGVLSRRVGEVESPLLALKLKGGWFGVEGEVAGPKEPELTSRVTHEFKALESKTRAGASLLLLRGARREAVFCDTCANPIARTIPSTTYESEFMRLCVLTDAQVRCADAVDSRHDQDGPSQLLFTWREDGAVELEGVAGRLTKKERAPLTPGVYTLLAP